ncbi:MAG: hypothetical protein ACK424_00980, partial [Candidatus Thermochlorobacter sp.]
ATLLTLSLTVACDAAPPAPGTPRLAVAAQERIKDDFEKVFLVTHLDKLHEQFETKIFVSKDAVSGSHFEVVFN